MINLPVVRNQVRVKAHPYRAIPNQRTQTNPRVVRATLPTKTPLPRTVATHLRVPTTRTQIPMAALRRVIIADEGGDPDAGRIVVLDLVKL